MSVSQSIATGSLIRRLCCRVFRVGFPQVVIGLAAFLYFATQIGAGRHVERQWFNLFRMLVLIAAGTLLALWALFFTGLSKLITSGVLAVLIGGGWATFRVEYDGDLRQSLHVRGWLLSMLGIAHEDDVAAHRKSQANIAKQPIDLTPRPDDFPGYRGADRTGVVHGPRLDRRWEDRPPKVVWKQPIYGGYSSFAVVNGFLFTMEQRRDDEAVVCYDAANGNELWVHDWPGRFDESMGGPGPRATPTVYDDRVYALGAFGRIVCLDGRSGELLWAVDTLAGNQNLRWAMSASPLVYDNVVVVNPGAQSEASRGRALVAYDRLTGKPAWSSGKSQAGYTAPMLACLAGHRQILLFDGAGLAGCDPASGAELWRHSWRTQGSDGINVAQPIVLERETSLPISLAAAVGGLAALPIVERPGQVFIASGYGRGGALLQIDRDSDRWSVQELWTTGRTAMRCKFSSPVAHNGFVYGFDDGNLQCLDLNDGRVLWTDTREPDEGAGFGHGQLLLSGDLLVILTQFGEIALVEANAERFHELGRMKVLKGKKTWSNPALVDGKLYIRNHLEMACVDLK